MNTTIYYVDFCQAPDKDKAVFYTVVVYASGRIVKYADRIPEPVKRFMRETDWMPKTDYVKRVARIFSEWGCL